MGRCYLRTDYEKYLCQISVLVITNLIGVQPKLSASLDELLFRWAESWKAEKVTYRWLRETYIQLYFIFWIIITLPSNITH